MYGPIALLVSLSCAAAPPSPEAIPPYLRDLGPRASALVARLEAEADRLVDARRYREASGVFDMIARFRAGRQGGNHHRARTAAQNRDFDARLAALSPADRDAWERTRAAATEGVKAYNLGDFARAEAAFRRAIRERTALVGRPAVSASSLGLYGADVYIRLNRNAEAEAAFHVVLTDRLAVTGENSSGAYEAMIHLGWSLSNQGKHAEARTFFARAVKAAEAVVAPGDVLRAHAYENAADNLVALGEGVGAARLYGEALRIRRATGSGADVVVAHRKLAWSLVGLGRRAEADPHFVAALRGALATAGPEGRETALAYFGLAFNRQETRRDDDALRLYLHAVPLCRRVLGAAHPATAQAAENLGRVYVVLGDDRRALHAHEDAVSMRLARPGTGGPDLARSLEQVGVLRARAGDLAGSEGALVRAVELFARHRGEDHDDTGKAVRSLLFTYEKSGRADRLIGLYRRHLASLVRRVGEEHEDTAFAYNNFGGALLDDGKPAEAVAVLKKATTIRRKLRGSDHPDTLNSLNSWGLALAELGEYAEGEALVREALRLRRRVFKGDHMEVAVGLNGLAHVLGFRGFYAEAQRHLEESLRIRRKLLGDDHPDVGKVYNNLASNLAAQGKEFEAEKMYREAVRIHLKSSPNDHVGLAQTYSNLAQLYSRLGLPDKGDPLSAKARDIFVRRLGEDHSQTAQLDSNLASAYQRTGRTALARRTFETAYLNLRRRIGPDHPKTLLVGHNLASALHDLGKYADADRLHREVIAARRRVLGDRHRDLGVTLHNFALLLAGRGDTATAATLAREAADVYETTRLRVHARKAEVGLGESTGDNPYPLLVTILAGRGDAAGAWQALERFTARGLLDESAARDESRLSAEQRRRRDRLAAEIATATEAGDAVGRAKAERELGELAASLSRAEVATLAQARAAVPADAAVVSWSCHPDKHARLPRFACVLRRDRDPVFVPIGEAADAGRLRAALADAKASTSECDALVREVTRTQFLPLVKHLDGVKRICVAAVFGLEGVPVELLAPGFEVSYVPSATWLARLKDAPEAARAGTLAVGVEVYGDSHSRKIGAVALRSEAWRDLPGARLEVSRLKRHFADTVELFDADATPAALEEMRAAGKLADFRRLHFAAHGEADGARAFRTSLVLSGGARLTAEDVLSSWKLRADLVTLSACETALGKHAGGDGALGFAQAFLLAGSRSVCLSLWKVSDDATALLMDRFYANLAAGKAKAAALAEAKSWLRNLSAADAEALLGKLVAAAPRGKGGTLGKVVARPDGRPYAPPQFWAGFVLVGDPG